MGISAQGLPVTSKICPRTTPSDCAAASGISTASNSATLQMLNNHELANFLMLDSPLQLRTAYRPGVRGPLSLDSVSDSKVRNALRGHDQKWDRLLRLPRKHACAADNCRIPHTENPRVGSTTKLDAEVLRARCPC